MVRGPAGGAYDSESCTSVDRVQAGQIAEHWADLDFVGFMRRLTEGH